MKQTQLSCASHERTINNSTKTEQKIEKVWHPTPSPPAQTLTSINQPPNFPSPITGSNNTMIMISLPQMRQCNGCGSVRNVIFNLHLGSGADPWVSILCLLQETSHIHWLHLPKQSPKRKQKILKKDQTPNKLYRIALAYIHVMNYLKKSFLKKIV